MALEIQNKKIVGIMDNLQEKLNGELPINRLELIHLVNSWGREKEFKTNENIKIYKCEAEECYDLSKLDTSEITDMSNLFEESLFNDIHSTNGIGLHNGDISNWDVSNVTDMRYMFEGAREFNQALDKWDVSSVTSMNWMFHNASNFNQDLNDWDVSNVKTMNWMFHNASNFNQALNNWDVSKVTDMYSIFYNAKEFNQALDNWDVSNVINMNSMFKNAIAFETKFNKGNPLPEETNELKVWFINNRDKMLAIETLNKESTPEQKIAIIENKISNNKTTLDDLFKEKNIDPNSKVGIELLKVYNDTHDKLKLDLEDLKTQVVDIATNDFNER